MLESSPLVISSDDIVKIISIHSLLGFYQNLGFKNTQVCTDYSFWKVIQILSQLPSRIPVMKFIVLDVNSFIAIAYRIHFFKFEDPLITNANGIFVIAIHVNILFRLTIML